MKKYSNIFFLCLLALCLVFLSNKSISAMKRLSEREIACVVLDAGHGGNDPGKVGINGVLEKDVNLSIVLYLKELLEQSKVKVVLTRETEEGLYSQTDSNKKAADMKKRVEIINDAEADLAVSIHQNSFTQEKVCGAQVFYFETSTEGKAFAGIMQECIENSIVFERKRVAKANNNYYLLKKSKPTMIIVECGFLSNTNEAELLKSTDYQQKLAQAIHLGIMTYINKDR